MVIPPPLSDLRHPAYRWQTVFSSTRPLPPKSVQNGEWCDIPATVRIQPGNFRRSARVFFATPSNKPGKWQLSCGCLGTKRGRARRAPSAPSAQPSCCAYSTNGEDGDGVRNAAALISLSGGRRRQFGNQGWIRTPGLRRPGFIRPTAGFSTRRKRTTPGRETARRRSSYWRSNPPIMRSTLG